MRKVEVWPTLYGLLLPLFSEDPKVAILGNLGSGIWGSSGNSKRIAGRGARGRVFSCPGRCHCASIHQASERNCLKSLRRPYNVALRDTEIVLFGSFWRSYTG